MGVRRAVVLEHEAQLKEEQRHREHAEQRVRDMERERARIEAEVAGRYEERLRAKVGFHFVQSSLPLIIIMYSSQDAEREAAVMGVRSKFEDQLKSSDALHDAAIREKDEAIRRLEDESEKERAQQEALRSDLEHRLQKEGDIEAKVYCPDDCRSHHATDTTFPAQNSLGILRAEDCRSHQATDTSERRDWSVQHVQNHRGDSQLLAVSHSPGAD